MNSQEIINLIASSKKKTIVKAYIDGHDLPKPNIFCFGGKDFILIIDELTQVNDYLEQNSHLINKYHLEVVSRNQALNLLDISNLDARIEPGAIIRELVEIGSGAIVMMGAVINVGAVIGDKTMIDMNAVIGARSIIGKNSHIGAGAVIAGVIEPPSSQPVIIGDNVLIGANATILEGVKIASFAIVGAGSVVTKDVEEFSVVVGNPARHIKYRQQTAENKVSIVQELRRL